MSDVKQQQVLLNREFWLPAVYLHMHDSSDCYPFLQWYETIVGVEASSKGTSTGLVTLGHRAWQKDAYDVW